MIGLGKLGLPVATAMASKGIEVFGFDPHISGFPDDLSYEENLEETVEAAEGRVNICEFPQEIVRETDLIFVAVQTPHDPRFEGITPLTDERVDFDYSYLRKAVRTLAQNAAYYRKPVTVSVISTVLPGTMKREIEPLLNPFVSLVYNPSFIAMGTTIQDFLDPEFALIGGSDCSSSDPWHPAYRVEQVYRACGIERFYRTTVPNAELIKVAYNTFIGLKLAFANTLMEVCHKSECDVDEVTGAMKLAHRRLISPAYLDGGMGDGGGCHPRDGIAMSWLARELDLSYDLFEAAMEQRQAGTDWLCDLVEKVAGERATCANRIGILGIAYKPGSHITTGSPARLAEELLRARGHEVAVFDPHVGGTETERYEPRVWLVGCKHPEFLDLKLPRGSVVIDPWRYMPNQEGVEVIRVGAAAQTKHPFEPRSEPDSSNGGTPAKNPGSSTAGSPLRSH